MCNPSQCKDAVFGDKIEVRVDADGKKNPPWKCARCGDKIRRVVLRDFEFKHVGKGEMHIFQFCPCGWYSYGPDALSFLDGVPLTCDKIAEYPALYGNEQFFALGGG